MSTRLSLRSSMPKKKKKEPNLELARAVGARLKACMKVKQWTQADMAEATESSPTSVNGWLQGKHLPTAEPLMKASEAFGVSVDWLLYGESRILISESSRNACRAHRGPEGKNFFDHLSTAAMHMDSSVRPASKRELTALLKELDGLRRDRENDEYAGA